MPRATAHSITSNSAIEAAAAATPFHPIAWLKAFFAERLLVLSLSRLSDRDLADIGMERHGIVEAIRGGRPNTSSMF